MGEYVSPRPQLLRVSQAKITIDAHNAEYFLGDELPELDFSLNSKYESFKDKFEIKLSKEKDEFVAGDDVDINVEVKDEFKEEMKNYNVVLRRGNLHIYNKFDETKLSVSNESVEYNGEAQIFDVNYEGETPVVTYSLEKDGEYVSKDQLDLVDAGTYSVYYKLNFYKMDGLNKVVVNGREVETYKEYRSEQPVEFTINTVAVNIGEEVRYFNDLPSAVASVKDVTEEVEIKLLRDMQGDGVKVQAGQNIVFNLNGHSYTIDGTTVGSAGTETNAFQLLKDSTVTFKNGSLLQGANGCKILLQNYSDLRLENVTIDGRNENANKTCLYTLSNNFGNIVITGNTRIIASQGQQAFDLWFGLNGQGLYDDGVNVTFDDNFTGYVEGIIEYGAQNGAPARKENWRDVTALTIKGNGTFNTTFVASGNTAIEDANIKIYSGKFGSNVSGFVVEGSQLDGTETIDEVKYNVVKVNE